METAQKFLVRQSPTLKGLAVGILSLLLLIPVAFVSGLISERQSSRADAEAEVASSWGLPQNVSGPVLAVPYRRPWESDDSDGKKARDYYTYTAYFLPERLDVKGDLAPERRYRGIFEFVLYEAKLQLQGNFAKPDFSLWKIPPQDVQWDQATVLLAVGDAKGINREVQAAWNGLSSAFLPGVPDASLGNTVIQAPVQVRPDERGYEFSVDLSLKGSSHLNIGPVGRHTVIELDSPWAHPAFTGAFLPDSRTVSDKGFSARWEILELNRSYPQQWTTEVTTKVDLGGGTGVDFKLPVDHYSKTRRTLHYAILFIGLTFLAFYLVEILAGVRVHPIQYSLVGAALVLFYLLLLSLSEHITFGLAYAVASLGAVSLIGAYTFAVARRRDIVALISAVLSGLYGFLFFTLQLEDYALLVGSLGLFAILAAIMWITRKVNWYEIGAPANLTGPHPNPAGGTPS
ncbi:MAG: cell envelope integrity protein CreD [Bdellovibrionota bacterium]